MNLLQNKVNMVSGRIDRESAGVSIKTSERRLRLIFLILPVIFSILFFGFLLSSDGKNSPINSYRIVPEYDRSLKKVVISLGTGEKTLELHSELLGHLPSYTEIILLLPKNSLQNISDELKGTGFGKRTKLIPFEPFILRNPHLYFLFPERDKLVDSGVLNEKTVSTGSLWAQDLFEVAKKKNGQNLILTSDVYKWFTSFDGQEPLNVASDNSFIGSLSSVGVEIRKLPLTFRGGNIFVDEVSGKKVAITGGDVFRLTRTVWNSTKDASLDDAEITKMLERFLNVDQVLVVGRAKAQPSLMFHLDQAMIIFHSGVVGITRIVKDPSQKNAHVGEEVREVEIFLSELRSVLSSFGFRLVDIDTSVHNVLNHQYYVNAIPYVDRNTAQRTLLMPVFVSNQTAFEKELIKKNTRRMESLGYRVVQVSTMTDRLNGGIHCLVNVLE